MCDKGEVEDVEHFYRTVMVWQRRERRCMVRLMNEITEGWYEMGGKDKVVCVVDKACENGSV